MSGRTIKQGSEAGAQTPPLLRASSPLKPKINRELTLKVVQQTGALQRSVIRIFATIEAGTSGTDSLYCLREFPKVFWINSCPPAPRLFSRRIQAIQFTRLLVPIPLLIGRYDYLRAWNLLYISSRNCLREFAPQFRVIPNRSEVPPVIHFFEN